MEYRKKASKKKIISKTRKRPYKKKTIKKPSLKTKYSSSSPLVSVLLKRHRDSQGNHHHVILEDIDDCHVSVGTTTSPKKGNNSPNYKCGTDILGNGAISYLRRQGIVDFKTSYSDPKHGIMTEEDYIRAQIYGQRAKEKYLSKKKKK